MLHHKDKYKWDVQQVRKPEQLIFQQTILLKYKEILTEVGSFCLFSEICVQLQ